MFAYDLIVAIEHAQHHMHRQRKAKTDDDIVIGGVLQARTIFSMHKENSCVIFLAKQFQNT